jgi:hypothetical protein
MIGASSWAFVRWSERVTGVNMYLMDGCIWFSVCCGCMIGGEAADDLDHAVLLTGNRHNYSTR